VAIRAAVPHLEAQLSVVIQAAVPRLEALRAAAQAAAQLAYARATYLGLARAARVYP
jgi:hypothetical protein